MVMKGRQRAAEGGKGRQSVTALALAAGLVAAPCRPLPPLSPPLRAGPFVFAGRRLLTGGWVRASQVQGLGREEAPEPPALTRAAPASSAGHRSGPLSP